MTYAIERRLDYIDWRLAQFGEVQRADIARTFGVSQSQASGDLNLFLTEHPKIMGYDKTRKRYVPANGRYKSVRGWTPTTIRAMRVLAMRGHPMGWRD